MPRKRKIVRTKRTTPPFEGKIKNWGLGYLRKNRWKIAAMCDDDDLKQDAFLVYWRVRQYHPEVTRMADFMKLYRVSLHGILVNRSKACFPNPYNLGQENHCMSLTADNGGDLTEITGSAVCHSAVVEVEDYLDLLQRLPLELRDAFLLLIREFTGMSTTPQRERELLNGKRRKEPFRIALARAVGCDVGRDLIAEIGQALGVVNNEAVKEQVR